MHDQAKQNGFTSEESSWPQVTTVLVSLQMEVDVIKVRKREEVTYLRKVTCEQNKFAGQVSTLFI